ncbi:MAG: isoprenylcysteine carboxylmethyltransferase family protein [Candidatus Thorarchaeota archaeon]|nr:MAG: isoprenylcysteine carboxylmethyltransferase family protein [Candidatus Thorarchaeota archaeon]
MLVKIMADETFYRILFVALYALFFSVRGYYRFVKPKRVEQETIVTERKEFGIAEGVITFSILGYFGATILYLLNLSWFAFTQIPAYLELVRWIGVALALASVPLLGWIHKILDRQYSACLQIKQSHSLITEGPYSRVRHPMYTILNMFSFGVALVTANFLVIGFALLLLLPFPFVAKKEEQMLLDTFGDEYSEYIKRTGRFFPRIRKI